MLRATSSWIVRKISVFLSGKGGTFFTDLAVELIAFLVDGFLIHAS
jgi:hypothetical protein